MNTGNIIAITFFVGYITFAVLSAIAYIILLTVSRRMCKIEQDYRMLIKSKEEYDIYKASGFMYFVLSIFPIYNVLLFISLVKKINEIERMYRKR